MERIKQIAGITQLFVENFINVVDKLRKGTSVPFINLLIGFVYAPKVLARSMISMGMLSEEQVIKINDELDEAVKHIDIKKEYMRRIEKYLEKSREMLDEK